MSQHESETIVSKQRTRLATTEQGLDAEEGPSRKPSDGKARNNGESERAESQPQGGLSALRTHHATPQAISEELAALGMTGEVKTFDAWMNSKKAKG